MSDAYEFHRLLLEQSGMRKRVELDLLLRIFRQVKPELAVTVSARTQLREIIDLLEAESRIETPRRKGGWDHSGMPGLPKWVLLVRVLAEPPSEADLCGIPWAPELRFLPVAKVSVPVSDLLKLQKFFATGGRTRCDVPLKERSLEIFGDEKRLDDLYRGSALFADNRLTLSSLRCVAVPEPLPWTRGKATDGPLLILENVATWDSYRRWNIEHELFSGIVYGGGNRFIDSVLWLRDIFADVGGLRRVLYFGDVDPAGLRIPRLATVRAVAAGLPIIEPDIWSYSYLFDQAERCGRQFDCEHANFTDDDCAWLGLEAERARKIFLAGKRIPQEVLGWAFLKGATRVDDRLRDNRS
jgi:hypothetical protein